MLVAETSDMATAVQNITLSAPRNIPLSKLVLSQANVKGVKAGVSIEKLGRGHLPPHVSAGPQRTAGTGTREPGDRYVRGPGRQPPVPGARTAGEAEAFSQDGARPCMVREGGSAEDDSLAENVHRVALHRSTSSTPSRPCGETGAIQIGSISPSCFWAAIVHGSFG